MRALFPRSLARLIRDSGKGETYEAGQRYSPGGLRFHPTAGDFRQLPPGDTSGRVLWCVSGNAGLRAYVQPSGPPVQATRGWSDADVRGSSVSTGRAGFRSEDGAARPAGVNRRPGTINPGG